MKIKFSKSPVMMLAKLALAGLLCLVIVFIVHSNYKSRQGSRIELKSRYTFSVRIDSDGNVLDEAYNEGEKSEYQEFETPQLSKMADIWLTQFTGQFTQKYLPWSKALRKVSCKDSKVLDRETGTVLISFSAVLKDSTSEYFQSWDGVLDNGRMEFEWVVTFALDNHYDGTATIYVENIVTPEEYGISQYNESLKDSVTGGSESATAASSNTLTKYEIKENTLQITYDGGAKYVNVPVDCTNLPLVENSSTQLMDGSWQLDTNKAAFLYGGKNAENGRVPVTLLFSNDKGSNWVTSEIDTIYDANYYYVKFFDETTGVIVIGYGKNGSQQASRIYTTANGGESWIMTGSGPALNVLKGVVFADADTGFFCYNYVDGMDSNLYMTKDLGKTFSKVTLDPQELDSTAANAQTTESDSTQQETKAEEETTASKLSWSDVYKEALVPVVDDQGMITVYLTQGSNGENNRGKTAAKNQSSDGGETWKYIGQLEITS